jgi:hypothetical protein
VSSVISAEGECVEELHVARALGTVCDVHIYCMSFIFICLFLSPHCPFCLLECYKHKIEEPETYY